MLLFVDVGIAIVFMVIANVVVVVVDVAIVLLCTPSNYCCIEIAVVVVFLCLFLTAADIAVVAVVIALVAAGAFAAAVVIAIIAAGIVNTLLSHVHTHSRIISVLFVAQNQLE